jgi:hypothetical protein
LTGKAAKSDATSRIEELGCIMMKESVPVTGID